MTLFSEGIKEIPTLSDERPEGHICGECVRFYEGYQYCCPDKDRGAVESGKACALYWDKAEQERLDKENHEATEKRREELWAIYADKEPVKLPIIFDGYGTIPECPVCGEMPYSTEQCHWCGQHFIQDEETTDYAKPETKELSCFRCGEKVIANISKYNGHISYQCSHCGISIME